MKGRAMTSLTRRMAALAAAGMFSLPAAAGQEDQFLSIIHI